MVDFLLFELKYRFRQPAIYLFALLFGLFTFGATTTDAVSFGGAFGQTGIDSPYVVIQLLAIMSVLAVLLVVAFTASTVIRDFDLGTYDLFYTKPIRKTGFLVGRFLGGTSACVFVLFGAALGLMVGRLMPWLDPARLTGFHIGAYINAFVLFVVPNLLIMGAFFFALATLTRRMLWAYVGVVAFFVFFGIADSLIADLDNDVLAALTDPFGLNAFKLTTRYWTPAERNTMVVPLDGIVMVNRLLWLVVAAGIFAMTALRVRLQAPSHGRRRDRADAPATGSRTDAPLPRVNFDFSRRGEIAQWRHQLSVEVRGIIFTTPFALICMFAVFNVFGAAFGTTDELYGTPVYPVTHLMVRILEGTLALFMLIVITFYAGELVWRERKNGMAEVFGALPLPNWVAMTSKLGALMVAACVLSLVGVTATVGLQIIDGYFDLEPGLYLADVFGLALSSWLLICVLAFFFQVAANHRYAGYGLMVAFFVLRATLPAMGFEHDLYNYSAAPRTVYSDMNGYGHFVESALSFRLYWTWAAFGLVLIANLFWIRGTDNRIGLRIRAARRRITRANTVLLGIATLGFFGTGAYVFYNTNVINDYSTRTQSEDRRQRYEEQYKQYEDFAQPRIIATSIEADLFPEERRLELRGRHTLRNMTQGTIERLHVVVDPDLKVNALGLPDEAVEHFDEEFGYRIYRLPEPLAPGGTIEFEFDLTFEEHGFKLNGSNTAIVANGTFFHNTGFVPAFGYQPGFELSDPNERRDRGLPERPRMPALEDEAARRNNYISREADWIDFNATVSTSADQIALAPGYLVDSWEKNGRKYFRYEMDAPILNLWAIMSADYQVKRDKWNDVAIEIYYHEPHTYNVDRMIDTIKKSLDYYTTNFSPYQHKQVRVVEFPRYNSFAQSLPNIIPYSESIGFIADLREEENIDYVFYVTAHEVAHQWWAHQVIGAEAQGSTVMSETLAQYSALMVMEREYGRDKMRKFLAYELDRYLAGRPAERDRELPLLRVENQPYIHYNKGSLAMYALREYAGEEAINAALAAYLRDRGFQQPPYTTSREFVDRLYEAVPDKYDYLVEDYFEKIVLYDNRTKSARAQARPGGGWSVTLEVESIKYEADDDGAESEVDMNDWIEIGVFGDGPEGEEPELYRQQHRLQSGTSTITIEVDQEPKRAGVDPTVLLVDRNPEDNLRNVELQ